MDNVVLALHVLAAIAAFGPSFAAPFLYAAARRQEPAVRVALLRVQYRIDRYMVLPAMLVLPLTGAYLIAAGDWSIGNDSWLSTAIGIYALILVAAVLVAVPGERRLLAAAEAEAEGRPAPPGAAATSRRVRTAGWLILVGVLAILYLMVAQPG